MALHCFVASVAIAHEHSARPPIRDFDALRDYATQVVGEDYVPPRELPEALATLTYDQYRKIAFRPERAIWANDKPFSLQAFHRGYVQRYDVALNLIEGSQARRVRFDSQLFEYFDELKNLRVPADTGFAGIRVHGRFPNTSIVEEMLTFLGASYFRARVVNHPYGASARGLAIDVGLPKAEEFPAFREFWVEEPTPNADHLVILALLDSPCVVGAYELTFHPRSMASTIDIRATLYFRRVPDKVGIAPLTSMWMWGDGLEKPPLEFRPEVHDSDGLLIAAGDGRWLWRALNRQEYPSLVRFVLDSPSGFGLIQRDRDRAHYLDDEAEYHERPSVWVEPLSAFGQGAVELLELPGGHEGVDDIGAWWTPTVAPVIGQPYELRYRVTFFPGDPPDEKVARAVAMRVDRSEKTTIRVEVDFQGEALSVASGDSPPTLDVSAVRGEISASAVERVDRDEWRLVLDVRPTESAPIELTAGLSHGGATITETWSYLCAPTPPNYKLPQVYTRIE